MEMDNFEDNTGIFPHSAKHHSMWALMLGFPRMPLTNVPIGQPLMHSGVRLNYPHEESHHVAFPRLV